MADYDIAPASSTTSVSLGAMRKSLVAEADYNGGSKHTTAITSFNTLVTSATTYQSNVDSSTWNKTSPHKFSEMYGKTWSDGAGGTPTTYTLTLSVSNGGDNCDRSTVTITQGGTTLATMTSTSGGAPSWNNSSITVSTTSQVTITATSQGGGGAGCETFDTDVSVSLQGTTVISGVSSATTTGNTHSFTPSANQTLHVTSVATQ